jgi:GT2 family glycosyltransferase
MATHDRPDGLRRQLEALRAQTLADDQYEIVVVDDASGPQTAAVLREEADRPGPRIRTLRHDVGGGPARARNTGWRAAQAPLIAFTDDDCRAAPGWLQAGLDAWDAEPRRFVQGPTRPDPDHAHLRGPLAHTLVVERLGPWWETANIFYPRAALEEAGGFDEGHYSGPGGEDTDLGQSLVAAGYEPVWAPDAVVYHAVTQLTPRQKLRLAWRWDETMLVFKRHPELRRHLIARYFWSANHWWLVRALVALALPRRLWWMRWWLAAPYVLRIETRRPDVAAVLVANDVVEMAACARGGVRYRVPVL